MTKVLRLILVVAAVALAQANTARANSGGGHGAEPAPSPAKQDRKDHKFWESWVPMLGFTATKIPGLFDQERVDPVEGRMMLVVFIASWCEPCQLLMPELVKLQHRYRRLNVDFIYVFMHDTREDAEGFMKEFNVETGYLANADVHKVFHNPELPTIYVGDRHKWLASRYIKPTREDLAKLDDMMRLLTAL